MAGSNPWFKNARVPIESLGDEGEDMTQSEREDAVMGTLLVAEREARHVIIEALDDIKPSPARRFIARCGGLLNRNSIKQKTRLNRDRRNAR